ncbi:MAG: hypothetical protein N2110_01510 [Flavobacteriales bacterium]|nr:hypothetical protein [Flavobacteriales bacterium]MCX7767687.1 hypothetical protein [Flavobacteriales bacterium]MDW8409418.1 hypothetical protein [Flavobacteriales bacterium]
MFKVILVLTSLLFSAFILKAQNPALRPELKRLPDGTLYREVKVVDHPTYPTYKHTGRPEEDEKRYQQEKAAWIQNNPEAYRKMNESAPLTEEQKAELRKKQQKKDR